MQLLVVRLLIILFLSTVYRNSRSLSAWKSATKLNTVQWKQRSKLLMFLFRKHQKECHNFLLFLATHKIQMNRISLRWWLLKLVKWMQWNTETLSFWMIQHMVLRARYSVTRHSLFHTLMVVINACIWPIKITIRRTAKVRWLVAHQLHQL